MVKVCNTSVCVECSLRDECLRCYAFCKHSKSPIFNRSMRVLNRLPIYLGEDLCDKINRDAVIKDIVGFNKKELKSVEYTPTYSFCGGRYSPENIHNTYFWINKNIYPTGYRWIQKDNSLDAMCSYGVHSSRHIESYYKDTKNAKKKFRGWFKTIAHNRIVARFNLNYNKMYGEDNIVKRRFLPLWDESNYWIKQRVRDYNPLRNPKVHIHEQIRGRAKYVFNGNKVASCRKLEHLYTDEVDETRINRYERYKRLYKETKDINESLWYLMQMGMLCYNDKTRYIEKKSKEYHWMGSLVSHTKFVNDGRMPLHHLISYNDEEDWSDNHYWVSERCKHYDLKQRIYMILCHDGFPFHLYHKYHSCDAYEEFGEFLHTDIKLPKINHINHHYRMNVMDELLSKTRRIRSDCGRSRGKNIRTKNPHYCIFSLYPEHNLHNKYLLSYYRMRNKKYGDHFYAWWKNGEVVKVCAEWELSYL